MKKEDIKNEKMYMQIDTGSVDTGKGWKETLFDLEERGEASEDLHLVEVVKDASGNWVEA
jgi:hypothetical protein